MFVANKKRPTWKGREPSIFWWCALFVWPWEKHTKTAIVTAYYDGEKQQCVACTPLPVGGPAQSYSL
jgi:hypothetical protein